MVGCAPCGPNVPGLYLQFPNDYSPLDLCCFLRIHFKNQPAVVSPPLKNTHGRAAVAGEQRSSRQGQLDIPVRTVFTDGAAGKQRQHYS